jgi:hypothetical protein
MESGTGSRENVFVHKCYLILEFDIRKVLSTEPESPYRSSQGPAPDLDPNGFVFQRFALRGSSSWDGHNFRKMAQTTFFMTEADSYQAAQDRMVEAVKHLAPLMKDSLWPSIFEWMKKQNLIEE